jgi:tripartite-type tricarboxylate transporter receptor subunit TctC
MKKFLAGLLLSAFILPSAVAKETITILSFTGASGTLMPYLYDIVAKANYIQDKYTFVAVPKPGASGLIAVQTMDQSPSNTLVLAGTGFTEYVNSGQLNNNRYQPLSAMGNTCWLLISNRGDEKIGVSSLRGEKSLTVGSVGYGSAAHLTALMAGQKFGIDIRNITFKSTVEAGALMVGDESINLIVDSPQSYKNYKVMNPKVQALGVTCLSENPNFPGIQTLKSQGLDVPHIWSTITASKAMPEEKRRELAKILDNSLRAIGQKEIFEKYSYSVPVLNNELVENDFKKNQDKLIATRKKFSDKIVNQ